MKIFGKIAIAIVLAGAAAAVPAATKTVLVGGYTPGTGGGYYGGGGTDTPTYAFDPPTLTINAGDSVTFTNLGGIAVAHNVVADGLFRCANGCDGKGGNGNPATNEWTATVTFTQPGTVTYYCENHRSMGMTGTITVNAIAASGQNVVGGLSGNWDDPTPGQSGHGFQIEVLPGNGLLAIWFVFNPAGTAQNWIYAQGTYDPASSTTTIPAFLEQGGAFPPNFDGSKISAPPWGSLTLAFADCGHGTATWAPNNDAAAAGYAAVSFPIQRVTQIAGVSCP